MSALARELDPRPHANGALRQEDTPRVESLIRLVGSKISLRVMIYRGHVSSLRSLVILNSVEYPMPPSVEFCEHMWAKGLQVIFVERPGFGSTARVRSSAGLNRARLDAPVLDVGGIIPGHQLVRQAGL